MNVSSLFFSSPKLVSTITDNVMNKYLSYGKNDVDYPVYILVNGQTASAAEILASALKVHLHAKIIGTQTYGKGSVQELFNLDNGGQIKITVAHWLTADGQKLDGVGITPDIIVAPRLEDFTS